MSALVAATLGGFISFLSTSLGAVLSQLMRNESQSPRWSLSIDFALGLMVSASAFTLIGPAAVEATHGHGSLLSIVIAAVAGMLFVALLKGAVRSVQGDAGESRTNHLLLASVLMLHNFPEGLASGAAMAGLDWSASAPILGGISLQNVPEGALMVICLRAMGWRSSTALLGGIGSGAVEMAGGVLAGVLLQALNGILPLLLSFAGGAMMTSVLVELLEGEGTFARRVVSAQFGLGFALLPMIQLATG